MSDVIYLDAAVILNAIKAGTALNQPTLALDLYLDLARTPRADLRITDIVAGEIGHDAGATLQSWMAAKNLAPQPTDPSSIDVTGCWRKVDLLRYQAFQFVDVRSTLHCSRRHGNLKLKSQCEVVVMGAFYTDEKIQEAIAVLESDSPGIWEDMKKMALMTDPLNEEEQREKSAIVRALTLVLPKVPFIARAEDKTNAVGRMIIDVGNAVRAAVASARDGS
jgi:hypothetical protein